MQYRTIRLIPENIHHLTSGFEWNKQILDLVHCLEPCMKLIKPAGNEYDKILQAWENHLMRNQSVIVDLFHGQIRSQVGFCNLIRSSIDNNLQKFRCDVWSATPSVFVLILSLFLLYRCRWIIQCIWMLHVSLFSMHRQRLLLMVSPIACFSCEIKTCNSHEVWNHS